MLYKLRMSIILKLGQAYIIKSYKSKNIYVSFTRDSQVFWIAWNSENFYQKNKNPMKILFTIVELTLNIQTKLFQNLWKVIRLWNNGISEKSTTYNFLWDVGTDVKKMFVFKLC